MPPKKKGVKKSSRVAVPAKADKIASLFQSIKQTSQTIPESFPNPDRASKGKKYDLVHALANTLHGMYLVSRIEQAQSGRGVRDSSEEVPLSLTIEPRWLEAVTQYCNRRVSLDDVAKVCAAFPELIEVKWVVRDRTDLLYKEVAEAEHSNRSPKSSPKRGKKRPRDTGLVDKIDELSNLEPIEHDLIARIRLLSDGVPSEEEGVEILSKRIQSAGNAKKQKELKDAINLATALSSYKASRKENLSTVDESVEEEAQKVRLSGNVGDKSRKAEDLSEAEKERLLSLLSPELKSSLSEEKLLQVLVQTSREVMGVDERERQEIHEAQTREQTVTYFELIRSLFGKIKEQYNAAQLVRQLHELNPYPEKTEGGKEQLGVLLQYESSGLTAVTYDEASSQVVQLGSKLAQLPTEELNNVLIHFNREKASVAKLRKDLSDAVL